MAKPTRIDAVTITIVVLAYNEADYIAGCLDSLARQTRPPDEVLLIDNNCTDDTVKIAESYPFVRIIHESEQGMIIARNRGFREARGDIVARIDSDVRLSSSWVHEAVDYFSRHLEITAITGPGQFYNFPLKRLCRSIHTAIYYHLQTLIAGGTILWGANMAARRLELLQILPECPQMSGINEDIYMSLIMQRHGMATRFVPAILTYASLQRGNFRPRHTIHYLSSWPVNYQRLGKPGRAVVIYAVMILILVVAVPLGAVLHLRRDSYA